MWLKFAMLHLLVWNAAFSIHMILSKLRKLTYEAIKSENSKHDKWESLNIGVRYVI